MTEKTTTKKRSIPFEGVRRYKGKTLKEGFFKSLENVKENLAAIHFGVHAKLLKGAKRK